MKTVKTFKPLIFSMVALSISLFSLNSLASNSPKKVDAGYNEVPDFAYPATVVVDQKSSLEKALKEKNFGKIVQSAMNLTVAKNLISHSNADSQASLLDSLAGIVPSPYSNLLYLMEADLVKDVYKSDSWKFSQRNLPLDNYPENFSSWSKDLFAKRVVELIGKACPDIDFINKPISEFSQILSLNKNNNLLTQISQFICLKGNAILTSFSSQNKAIIPFGNISQNLKTDISDDVSSLREKLIKSLMQQALMEGNEFVYCKGIIEESSFIPQSKLKTFLYDNYKKNSFSVYSYLILNKINSILSYSSDSISNEEKEFYDNCKTFINRFSDYEESNQIKNIFNQMQQKSVNVFMNSQFLSSDSVKIKVKGRNASTFNLLIYRLPEDNGRNIAFKNLRNLGKLHKIINLSFPDTIPFISDTVINLGSFPYGTYSIVPSETGSLSGVYENIKKENYSLSTFIVSDLTIIYSRDTYNGKNSGIFVVDGHNMQPIANANVELRIKEGKTEKKLYYETDVNGYVSMPMGSSEIIIRKGKDNLYVGSSYFYSQNRQNIDNLRADIFTDLSVYHPGDTARFFAITYRDKERVLHAESGCKIKATLLDANGKDIRDTIIVTDKFGRAENAFLIPKSGLLGNWNIRLNAIGEKEKFLGICGINVSEYKLPTFYVEIDSVENRNSSDSVVCVLGKAKTYSGMPVAGAEVKFNIKYTSWWLWRGEVSSNATYSSITETDSEGNFVLKLSTGELNGTPYSRGAYQLNVSVTSSSGETREAKPAYFSLGNAYSISSLLPSILNLNESTPVLNVIVKDILGNSVSEKLVYEIYNSVGKLVESSQFTSPMFTPGLKNFKSGEYTFKFYLVSDRSVNTENKVILVSDKDVTPPIKTALWLCESKMTAKEGEKTVNVKFGSSYKNSNVLCIIYDCNQLIERKWVNVSNEITSITVPTPSEGEKVWVEFIGMHNLSSINKICEINPSESSKKLKIKVLSFRDKINSGEKESWSFKFEYAGQSIGFIPVSAVMTDKALNSIAPFEWHFNPIENLYYPQSCSANIYRTGNMSYFWNISKIKYLPFTEPVLPAWNTGGYSLYSGMYSTVSTRKYMARGVSNETLAMKSMAMNDAVMDMGIVEEAKSKSGSIDEIEESSEDGLSKKDVMELRRDINPLAFFRPLLTTDANGILSLEFEVPDYNTTWQLQLMGYTESMKTSQLMLDAVSSKPVMVSVNSPRFLRYEDKDNIKATIFNNTDEDAICKATIQAFNSLTGELIASHIVDNLELHPNSSEIVSLNLQIPDSLILIDLRTIVESGEYSDGEIDRIEILPSNTAITESIPFYLGVDRKRLEIALPELDPKATATLQYCSNPIWYVISSLPSMNNPESKSLLPLLASYYSGAVATGLLNTYPHIKESIRQMIENDKAGLDSLLFSNLQKNNDLKIVDLYNTIWTGNASDESIRMLALSKFLNDSQCKNLRNELLKKILDLQNPDGGWSWCPGMKSSYFMTLRTLEIFSNLSRYGYLESRVEISSSIRNALNYCDSYFTKQKIVSPQQMLDYLYIKTWLKDNKETIAFQNIKKQSINKILSNWKSFSLDSKAKAAMLLKKLNYLAKANDIVNSIKQFASKDKNGSLIFDNLYSGYAGYSRLFTTALCLEAISYCQPGSEEVDLLRQSLIYQKETEDWGRNPYSVNVIQAILSGGAKWTEESSSPVIMLDNKELEIPRSEFATGYFRINLPVELVSKSSLKIIKNGESPSWGSLMTQYFKPIKDVDDYSINDLAIKKNIYVINDSIGATYIASESLKPGMKIRIMLEIVAGKDMEYVAVTDERAAFLEPIDQLSHYTITDGIPYYKEVRNTSTNLFISFLPKGTHIVYYDCYVSQEGEFSLGIATAQSQYAPQIVAHSAGKVVGVKE